MSRGEYYIFLLGLIFLQESGITIVETKREEQTTMKQSIIRRTLCAMLSATMLMGVCACSDGSGTGKKYSLSNSTTDLMANIEPSANALAFKKNEDSQQTFEQAYSDFALMLFKNCSAADSRKNTLVSPLSVMTALAMTANGAKGSTLEQMQKMLGGGMDIEQLNLYLCAYLNGLPSSEKAKLTSANSIWFKENSLDFNMDFLQTNADYFGADVFSSKFDEKTLADINGWVNENTGGMIPKALDRIPGTAVMYLINALSFDAEWQEIYREDQVYERDFTDIDGKTENVPMMSSTESVYLNDGKAQGFVKPYASGYSFVAMLPDEGISFEDYVKSLDYGKIADQIKAEDHAPVLAALPKFSAKYDTELSEMLRDNGMADAFDGARADFSGMADVPPGYLYISRVIHKTAIDVDERGTRAGAVTAVEMSKNAALMMNVVSLDRPFVYMIIDNESYLPIFIGQVTHIQ